MNATAIWIADSSLLSARSLVSRIFLSKLFYVGSRRGNIPEGTSMYVASEFRSTFTTLKSAESYRERKRVQGSSIIIQDMPCVAVQSLAGDQMIIVEHEEHGDGFTACKPQLQSEWRIGQFAKAIMSQSSVEVLTTKDELYPADLPLFAPWGFSDAGPAIDLVCRLNHWLAKSPGGTDDE
jgi:hypothetical protein